jgi:hypothetical protein
VPALASWRQRTVRTMKRWLPYLALAAIVVGFANFFWFMVESAPNGDALNGFTRAGHYFLVSHGRTTEVTQAAWEWSRFHAASVFVTHPLAMAGIAYLLFAYVFPNAIGPASRMGPAADRAQLVRGSGAMLARGRTSGRIGGLWLSGPLIEISVFPAGLVIKPFFMPARTILWSEIHGVIFEHGLFKRGTWIDHDGVEVASPILLRFRPTDPVVKAVERLTAEQHEKSRLAGEAPVVRQPPKRPGFWSSVWTTPLPRRDAAPRGIIATLYALGIVVGIALFAAGILWAIPTLGPFGWFWTAGVAGITIFNAIRIARTR